MWKGEPSKGDEIKDPKPQMTPDAHFQTLDYVSTFNSNLVPMSGLRKQKSSLANGSWCLRPPKDRTDTGAHFLDPR